MSLSPSLHPTSAESDVITTTDVEGGNSAEGDYIGCYRDSDSDPILPDFQYEDEEDLTPTVRRGDISLL